MILSRSSPAMRVLTGVKPWVLWRVFYLMGGGCRLGLVGGGLFTDVLGVGIVGVVGVFFLWWWGVGLLVLDRSAHAYGGVRGGCCPTSCAHWAVANSTSSMPPARGRWRRGSGGPRMSSALYRQYQGLGQSEAERRSPFDPTEATVSQSGQGLPAHGMARYSRTPAACG